MNNPKIFISYARSDDEPFVKRLYDDLTENGMEVWWDRVSMPGRSLTFLQEIRDAVIAVDRLVLVFGLGTLESDYVRAEWELALQLCKPINPVLRLGDYADLPDQLKLLDVPDFRDDTKYHENIKKFIKQLSQDVSPLGKVSNVPDLPANYLSRPNSLIIIKQSLLADVRKPVVASNQSRKMVIQGLPGVGKSVLAAAFARDCEVRRAFSDGIFWVTLGNEPSITSRQSQLADSLGDVPRTFDDTQQWKARLSELLYEKNCLIVLDDVWEVEHAQALDIPSPRCKILITTRNFSLSTSLGANSLSLETMTDNEAIKLLANWSGQSSDSLPNEAFLVAQECGNLPLALAMIGAMVKSRPNRWDNVLHKLRNADLGKIRQQFPGYPYQTLLQAIQVSVNALPMDRQVKYYDFSVFPQNTPIPEEAVQILWSREGLDKFDVQDIIDDLVNRSLVRRHDEGYLSLHDLQFDYLRKQAEEVGKLPNILHNQLLDAYFALCGNDWTAGPDDGYYYQYLSYHFYQSGRFSDLRELLCNFLWISRKLEVTNIRMLLSDFEFLDTDNEINIIRDTLRLSSHVLAEDKTQLEGQILGRMTLNSSAIRVMIDTASHLAATSGAGKLLPILPTLTPPDSPLLRTLVGHQSQINDVSITNDGSKVISVSMDDTIRIWSLESGAEVSVYKYPSDSITAVSAFPKSPLAVLATLDGTLKIWELENGNILYTLSGHSAWISDVIVTQDEQRIISASWDKTLKVWNLKDKKEELEIRGHTERINDICLTADGFHIISASDDKTIKMWNLKTGLEELTLNGHTGHVNAVAVSEDGRTLFSVSDDKTLRVWDLVEGKEIGILKGHTDYVNDIIVASNNIIITASDDKTLKVWDTHSGTIKTTLQGHTSWVKAIAVTSDNRYVVSASDDETIKIWSLTRAAENRHVANGHLDSVNSLVITNDGNLAASGSDDKTIKLWQLRDIREIQSFQGHAAPVNSIALIPNTDFIASASDDGTLRIWNMKSGLQEKEIDVNDSEVKVVVSTSDGQKLISASRDFTLKIWDLQTLALLHTMRGHTSRVTSVIVAPDGVHSISVSRDRTLKVWDLLTGLEMLEFKGHTSWVNTVAITSDGSTLITGSSDKSVRVWDIPNQKDPLILAGHASWVNSVAVSKDGQLIVSASDDKTVKLWDRYSGNLIASFVGESPMISCVITPDSKTVLAGEKSGRLHFLSIKRS